jgi:Subtilase family
VTQQKLPHIVLIDPPAVSTYTGSGGGFSTPQSRNRIAHGQYLQQKFNQAWQESMDELSVVHSTRNGVYLEFISDPDAELVTKSLEKIGGHSVRLLNVRKVKTLFTNQNGQASEQITTYATVYVAHTLKKFFADKIQQYLTEETKKGNPKHQSLLNSIASLRKALFDSFWVDSRKIVETIPEWIEVWLSSNAQAALDEFDTLLNNLNIESRHGVLKFPERAVKVIFATKEQLEKLIQFSEYIAEYRCAKTTASFFLNQNNKQQAKWVTNLLERICVDADSLSSVCILDTGVNHGHPLLAPLLSQKDCQTVDALWGAHDHDEHGTLMAGVVAYGDLTAALESSDEIILTHRLESVKILPLPPKQNAPHLWGYITSQAISLAQINAPERVRCICMAVTADDDRDRGHPSSWSAELDQLASGADDNTHRLIIVSAGNTSNVTDAGQKYPDVQLTNSVQDPAQSWNAIAVGAYTKLTQITDPKLVGYRAVAPTNGLSPFSTTSSEWTENKWPIKPELILEGGNLAIDGTGFVTECDELSLLSTYHDPQIAHFSNFGMTSAATAQLGWMAGKLQALNANFWPETVRALLIHSATWPEELKQQFINDDSKTSYKYLLSICGYGVPDIDRAMYSAQNSLTMIAQAELQPFEKNEKGNYITRDMHLYELPWPKDVLLNLPFDTQVEMRITLSYFIEPGPGEIGWKDRYRYASHALRFELNSPGELKSDFMKRISAAARDEDEGKPDTNSPSKHWVLGSQARNKGSIHSDIWQGTAQELAASNVVAITPTIGWWRERHHLGRCNKTTRYSLVISITTPDESIDLYTPVAIQVSTPIPIVIPTL